MKLNLVFLVAFGCNDLSGGRHARDDREDGGDSDVSPDEDSPDDGMVETAARDTHGTPIARVVPRYPAGNLYWVDATGAAIFDQDYPAYIDPEGLIWPASVSVQHEARFYWSTGFAYYSEPDCGGTEYIWWVQPRTPFEFNGHRYVTKDTASADYATITFRSSRGGNDACTSYESGVTLTGPISYMDMNDITRRDDLVVPAANWTPPLHLERR